MNNSTPPCVYIVDDDYAVRDSLSHVMEAAGFACRTFADAESFLQEYTGDQPGCLLLDLNMPDMNGDELQAELQRRNLHLPIIFLTAFGDIPTTVRVVKAGAIDFLTKPVSSKQLTDCIQKALLQECERFESLRNEQLLCERVLSLTSRELTVMSLIVAGHSNKMVARELGISYRTVEVHRARIMEKTGATSVLELARFSEICRLNQRVV